MLQWPASPALHWCNLIVLASPFPALGFMLHCWRKTRSGSRVTWRRWTMERSAVAILLCAAFACRIAFFVLRPVVYNDIIAYSSESAGVEDMINTLSLTLQFTAFTLVAVQWSRALHAATRWQFQEHPSWIILANAVAWVTGFSEIAIRSAGGQGARATAYRGHTLYLACISVAYALLVLAQGLRSYCGLRGSEMFLRSAPGAMRKLNLILACTVGAALLNVLRGLLFLRWLVAGYELFPGAWEPVVYPWLVYQVPEIGKAVLIGATLLPVHLGPVAGPGLEDRTAALRDSLLSTDGAVRRSSSERWLSQSSPLSSQSRALMASDARLSDGEGADQETELVPSLSSCSFLGPHEDGGARES